MGDNLNYDLVDCLSLLNALIKCVFLKLGSFNYMMLILILCCFLLSQNV